MNNMFSECSSLTTKSIRISQTAYNKIINNFGKYLNLVIEGQEITGTKVTRKRKRMRAMDLSYGIEERGIEKGLERGLEQGIV